MRREMAPRRKKVHVLPLPNTNIGMPNNGLTKVFHSRELDEDEIADIEDAFNTFDTDKDGKISSTELSEILSIFSLSAHNSEETYLKQLINEIDAGKNGKVELSDVLEVMKCTQYDSSTHRSSDNDDDKNLKYAFSMIDRDASGFITVKELKDVMKASANLLTDLDIDISTIDQFDEDNDGRLTFEEFKKMILMAPKSMPYKPPRPGLMREKSERTNGNLGLAQKGWFAEKEKVCWNNCFTPTFKFYLVAVGVPLFFALLYAIAILFPPNAIEKAPLLLWTRGQLIVIDGGKPTLCPVDKPYICSEGIPQIIFIAIARLTAFASYVMVGFVFVSKMHSTIHFLSSTTFSQTAPIENMHRMHSIMGMIYGGLALVHTVMHLVRWGVRGELELLVKSSPGLSGMMGMVSMTVVVLSMTLAKRCKSIISFEARMAAHWCFTLLVLAMAFHTPRSRIITCIFL